MHTIFPLKCKKDRIGIIQIEMSLLDNAYCTAQHKTHYASTISITKRNILKPARSSSTTHKTLAFSRQLERNNQIHTMQSVHKILKEHTVNTVTFYFRLMPNICNNYEAHSRWYILPSRHVCSDRTHHCACLSIGAKLERHKSCDHTQTLPVVSLLLAAVIVDMSLLSCLRCNVAIA